MMNEIKIDFPVVTIMDNWCIRYLNKLDDLIVVPKSVVTKGIYNGLEIIDCNNSYYKIANAEIREHLGLFKNKCRINLNFSEQSKKDWKTIKELLIIKVNNKIDFWTEHNLLDSILNIIENSKDSKTFINSFIKILKR
jgi:hypothetical protein